MKRQIIEVFLLCFRESVWSYFVKTSLQNLRIALSMSPSGDLLRTRCRSYPGLVNSTTIDWMFPWPEQALVSVANVTLRDVCNCLVNFERSNSKDPLFINAKRSTVISRTYELYNFFQHPNVSQTYRDALVEHMVFTHKTVCDYTVEFQTILRRRNYVTPKHYLDFINSYLHLLVETRDYINSQCDRLSGGS